MIVQKDTNGKIVLSDKQIDKAVQRIINKKKKRKTVTFTMFINNQEVTVVKYRELIDLDKLSPSSRRKVVKRCVLEILQKTNVETIDGKIVTIRSTKGADKVHFQAKQRIVLFLDELIRNAIPSESRIDYDNNRIQWFYYDSYILVDGIVYYWLINIRKIGGIYSFYDVTYSHHLKKWGFLRDDSSEPSINKLSGCVPSFVSISIPLLRIFFAAFTSLS